MDEKQLSDRLDEWLKGKQPKTLENLLHTFSDDSFAILLLVLMIFPAAPLPTGGITHVFEIISMLLGLELLFGRKEVWLPQKWKKKELSKTAKESVLPWFIKNLRRIEKYVKPGKHPLLQGAVLTRIIGLIVILFSFFAFIAVPFSNLDTLPALGVVLISLAMIFESPILLLLGLLSGTFGISLVIMIGRFILKL